MLASAVDESQAALADLRGLAHGIFPAILTEAGLAPALALFCTTAPLPVELGEVTRERASAPVETAAYVVVVEAVADAHERNATFVAVDATRVRERLVVEIRDDGEPRGSGLTPVADRIGALRGSVDVGPTRLRAEIPCG